MSWWGLNINNVSYSSFKTPSAILFFSICQSPSFYPPPTLNSTMWCYSPHASPKTTTGHYPLALKQVATCRGRFSNLFLSVLKIVYPSTALPFKKWLANVPPMLGLFQPWVWGAYEGSAVWTEGVTVKRASSTSQSQQNNEEGCILFSKASSFKQAVKQVKIGYLSINNMLSPLVTDPCHWQIGINIWDAKKKIEVIVLKTVNTFLKRWDGVGLNMRKDTIQIAIGVSTSLTMLWSFFGRGREGKIDKNGTEVRVQKRHKKLMSLPSP